MRLEDKVILITGASRGVGAACAEACAREGAQLALAAKTVEPHSTLPGTLGETAEAVRAHGRDALVLPCDVRFEEQVNAMVEQTVAHYGRLDALINNAGAIFLSSVSEFPAKRFDLVMGVNVRAAFLASRAAIPHLRDSGGGHVLMMSPPVNPAAGVSKAPYLVSKIGMTVLAQAIDAEEPTIAGTALWPVAGIKTAAVSLFGMARDRDLRTVDMLSQATVALLSRDPAGCSFRAWLDEEVMRELEGIDDFTPYRCDPDHEPDPHSIWLMDPEWKR
jgi:citronellol/citronellal dehydrogenase